MSSGTLPSPPSLAQFWLEFRAQTLPAKLHPDTVDFCHIVFYAAASALLARLIEAGCTGDIDSAAESIAALCDELAEFRNQHRKVAHENQV
jgi:hypothetical protein